jgi:hypothetical protein
MLEMYSPLLVIPLIGWFILGMIIVISTGTLASSVVIAVQKRGRLGERLSQHAIRIAKIFSYLSITDIPMHLRPGTRVGLFTNLDYEVILILLICIMQSQKVFHKY